MRELLTRVRRPIQYADGEFNAVRKEGDGLLRFALAFPDTYELGMSHLGLRILYHILNGRDDVAAERVFAPEDDMEALMRGNETPLATLETGTPLGRCHLVGFTLQAELHATNVLNMLDLGGIPLRAEERGPEHPFVVGGGPLALNPEPLADFFDLFVLGDAEEAVTELADAWWEWRNAGEGRRRFLERAAALPGVYVPSFYRVSYRDDGTVEAVEPLCPQAPPRIARRVLADLDRAPFPRRPLVPYLETAHDRLTVEIARGCVRGCRFCHAGMVYRPYRERSARVIEEIVNESLPATGYDEISLSALSTGDYCHLVPLVTRLSSLLEPRRISVSLPSIRPGSLPLDVVKSVGSVRKSGFTIAPEGGSERLRRVINKGISEDDVLQTARHIFANGWKSLKLYFMVGLPTETPEDVEGIEALALKIRRAAQEAGAGKPQITVSVSPFVPKPHTPFQWVPMAPADQIEEALGRISRGCRKARINFKWHHARMSLVEGILARGDRRLSPVIRRVWELGARAEAWTDRFDVRLWLEALEAEGLDPGFYTTRPRAADEVFPWDHIDVGVSRDFLLGEYRKSERAEESPPCRVGACRTCGACREETRKPGGEPAPPAGEAPRQVEDKRFRVRLRYSKLGDLALLSHLELFRTLYRAARRAELPLSFSEGFNPHPRISFAPPLPVGVKGTAELVDIELSSPFPMDRLVTALNEQLPTGLEVTAARYLHRSALSLFESIELSRFLVELPPRAVSDPGAVRSRIASLLKERELPVERSSKGRTRTKDVRPFLQDLELTGEGPTFHLELSLRYTPDGSARPAEILRLLFPGEYPWTEEAGIRRVGLYRLSMGMPVDAFHPPGPPKEKGLDDTESW